MSAKTTAIVIIVIGLLVGAFILLLGPVNTSESKGTVDNVSIVDGKQIIKIGAKGGYQPKNSIAKADIPTVLRVETRGTFDCSSALAIPDIGYRANLPQSGVTEINIPPQKSGAVLQGLCGMGMYTFKVKFQ
ncbi:MAG: hypothetical protein HZC04_01345 [Candidatus Lloydbacteria bacterium]|nr:hypothetical protein [Candidatus Lloydbacteria bacterium]